MAENQDGKHMNGQEKIRRAYWLVGHAGALYDGLVANSTISGRLGNRLMWGFDEEETWAWRHGATAGLDENFAGRLLEVPVGTGVLSLPLFSRMKRAEIQCVDYSDAMLERARARAAALGLSHVEFRQGDVGALPFADSAFDAVLSMNGFHVFPDKDRAFAETWRVLKPGGVFCGSVYIKQEFARTDWFVNHIYVRQGCFTPPFDTRASLKARLERWYTSVDIQYHHALATFVCRK